MYWKRSGSSGINVFSFTLDGIRVESEITNENKVCYKQFNDFSDKLKKFGIETKFEHETLDDDPNLRQKGELDLPDEGMDGQIEKD